MKSIFEAIKAKLENHFDKRVEKVAAYSPFTDKTITPAILIEVDEIDEGKDTGTGQAPQDFSFRLHCLLSCQTPDVEIEIIAFASELLQLVRQQNFGLDNCEMVENPSAAPSDFNPDQKKGYESWAVSFKLPAKLGTSDFNEDGYITPTDVHFSHAPAIGTAHESDYESLET